MNLIVVFKNCRFINREGIDFSDAEGMQAVQVYSFPCEYFANQNAKNPFALMF